MERDAAFEALAPRGATWTPWAKPVLFSYVDDLAPLPLPPVTWLHQGLLRQEVGAPDYRTNTRSPSQAIVVDLPGIESVAVGLALANLGFRPVPLYAAVPSANAVVPMWEVVRALIHGAEELPRKGLLPDAPPAFLLDARRGGGELPVPRGHYDNRSVVFSTDLPSPERLRETGIRDVVVIQSGPALSEDLEPILATWQAGHLPIRLLRTDTRDPASPIRARHPGLLRRFGRWLRGVPTPDDQGRFGRWISDLPQSG